jgi:hypothetical protein
MTTTTATTAIDRRTMLGGAGLLGAFLLDPRTAGAAEGTAAQIGDDYPTQEPAVVRELVGAAHGNVGRVRELVEARPELANAAWDWGFGDWESALGAASHMGRRDIAEVLLAHGARPDLFTAAMLGNLAAVRATVEGVPGIQRRRGPHGITLLAHARAGGEAAQELVAYLERLGDADPVYSTVPLGTEDAAAIEGTYAFGPRETDRLVIEPSSMGGLAIRRGDYFPRQLFHLGGLVFHPTGAPSARIAIDLPVASAPRLEIRNPDRVLGAIRVEGSRR